MPGKGRATRLLRERHPPAGTSPASNSVTLTFPGTCTPPGVLGNFQATKAGNRLTVSWDSPASGGAPDTDTLNVTGSFTGNVGTADRLLSGAVGPGCGCRPLVWSEPVDSPEATQFVENRRDRPQAPRFWRMSTPASAPPPSIHEGKSAGGRP